MNKKESSLIDKFGHEITTDVNFRKTIWVKFVKGIKNSSNNTDEKEKKFNIKNIDFSSPAPNIDGPIARNPHRRFEYNRTKEDYVNPIKSNLHSSRNNNNNNNNDNNDNN